MPRRHFVKYTFVQVDPAWRRLSAEQRAADTALNALDGEPISLTLTT